MMSRKLRFVLTGVAFAALFAAAWPSGLGVLQPGPAVAVQVTVNGATVTTPWRVATVRGEALSYGQAVWHLLRGGELATFATDEHFASRVETEMADAGATARELAARFTGVTVDNVIVARVGGSSGGLIMTLAAIDAATAGELTGGRVVAGTGTVDRDGTVGAIGGIAAKVVGAQASGATVFLADEADAAAARAAAKPGMDVITVSTVGEAVAALCRTADDAVCRRS